MGMKSTLSKYFNERVMQSPQYMIFTLGGTLGTAANLAHGRLGGAALGLLFAIAGGYCWRNEANKKPQNPEP